MNILQIPPYSPPTEGGSERYCFNLSKLLMKNGHNIKIFTSKRHHFRPFEEIEGLPVYMFRNFNQMLGINPLCFIIRRLPEATEWADVIHVHSYIYFLANQVALYRKMKIFPFILHLHGGLPYMPTVVYGTKVTMVKEIYDRTVGRWTIQTADRIIACCEHDKRMAIERFGADPSKIDVIPNSIYVDKFYSKPTNPSIAIFVGRLTRLKGTYLIPKIVKRVLLQHRDTRFWIVGGGPTFPYLEKRLKGLPVKLWKAVPHSTIPNLLAKSSILFLPSYVEGSPLVCLEGLASNLPVVATDVGGVSEVVRENETGFTVPVGDVDGMVERLLYLLENEKQRSRMGKEGRKLVEKEHNWKINVQKIMKIYSDFI